MPGACPLEVHALRYTAALSRGMCPFQIACQRNADDRCDMATIHRITLHNDNGARVTGRRADRLGDIDPPDFTLSDYHSTRRNVLRATSHSDAGSPSPDPRSHSWPRVFWNSPATVLGMASTVPDAEPRTTQVGHPNASQRPPIQGDCLAAVNCRGLEFRLTYHLAPFLKRFRMQSHSPAETRRIGTTRNPNHEETRNASD